MNIVLTSPPFDTSRLGHLQFWMQADKINQGLGSQINFLKDYSGFENDGVVTTTGPTKVPALRLTRGTTRPMLDMSINTQFTHVTKRSMPRVRPVTICCVFMPIGIAGNNNFLSTIANGLQINISPTAIVLIDQSVATLVTVSTTLLNNKAYILTATLSGGGTFSVFLNGVFINSGTSNTSLTTSTLTLGSNDYGYLFELMFFDDMLPRGETEKIEQYLNRKFGVF